MDAEQCVIGELLTDSEYTRKYLDSVYDLLEPQMFNNALYGRIYYEMKSAHAKNLEPDIAYVVAQVTCDDYPTEIVTQEISEVIGGVPLGASIQADAKVVFDDFNAKMLNKILSQVEIRGNNVYAEVEKLSKQLEKFQSGEGNVRPISEIASKRKDDYFKPKDKKPTMTGFDEWDSVLGGLEGGDMIVIGARPAVGKTALGIQIASNIADTKDKVLYFNLEMSEKQVYERLVSYESGISITRLKTAERFNTDTEQVLFNNANAKLEERENFLISNGSKDISQMRSEVLKHKPDIVFIDYLQLIKAAPGMSYKGNRYAEVGAISHAIKGIAIDFNIPVVVLTQLNRKTDAQSEPSMDEIRESGDIEQDASVIILLWNCDKDDKTRKGVKFDKNRQGELIKTELTFNGSAMRFEEKDKGFVKVSEEDELPFMSD